MYGNDELCLGYSIGRWTLRQVSVWRPPEVQPGGGARHKMAFHRCRRDPCGVICLILTYFSVFYADYVVIQYVLIPAYSDRSVFSLFYSNLTR